MEPVGAIFTRLILKPPRIVNELLPESWTD